MDKAFSLIISISVSVLCVALIAFLSYRRKPLTTRELALAAVCTGMSFGLSYIKIFEMPAGGAVTPASLAPVLVFAYIYGFRKGLIVGIAYGWLQIIQTPLFIVHPIQVLLDYIFAFGCIAFAGIFRNKGLPKAGMYDFLLGITLVGAGRFLCSFLAGIFFYAAFTPEGTSVWVYSAAYNSVLLIDTAICLAVCAALQYSPQFKRLVYQLTNDKGQMINNDIARRPPIQEDADAGLKIENRD